MHLLIKMKQKETEQWILVSKLKRDVNLILGEKKASKNSLKFWIWYNYKSELYNCAEKIQKKNKICCYLRNLFYFFIFFNKKLQSKETKERTYRQTVYCSNVIHILKLIFHESYQTIKNLFCLFIFHY